MIEKKNNLYVKDIIEYMKREEKHIEKIEKEKFHQDDKTCDMVGQCIEIIGEATKNIFYNIRNKYLSISWHGMVGMRDKIIHGYFVVDFENNRSVVKEGG